MYSQRGSMMRHLRLECGVVPQFQCPVCSYTSYRKGNINRHMLVHIASVEPRPGELGFWPTVQVHISLQMIYLAYFGYWFLVTGDLKYKTNVTTSAEKCKYSCKNLFFCSFFHQKFLIKCYAVNVSADGAWDRVMWGTWKQ